MNKNTVTLGDLRTEIEKIKWDNMRQAVGEWRCRTFSDSLKLYDSVPRDVCYIHCYGHGDHRLLLKG